MNCQIKTATLSCLPVRHSQGGSVLGKMERTGLYMRPKEAAFSSQGFLKQLGGERRLRLLSFMLSFFSLLVPARKVKPLHKQNRIYLGVKKGPLKLRFLMVLFLRLY